ncbi:MAG TPA: cupin domain-containing protein, partial [Solirubrobacterales bacterium]|nr:cupin domain-containing protein [Solirubrobacterales bacterium]
MANIYEPRFEEGKRPEGFKSKRARIGYELGTELIGCSLWEIPPGQAAYPYHYHYADEELLIVLGGEPSLRTPEGTRTLERGEAVHFPLGEDGAHQVFNDSEEIVTLLAVSSHGRPDLVVYPDGDKVGV